MARTTDLDCCEFPILLFPNESFCLKYYFTFLIICIGYMKIDNFRFISFWSLDVPNPAPISDGEDYMTSRCAKCVLRRFGEMILLVQLILSSLHQKRDICRYLNNKDLDFADIAVVNLVSYLFLSFVTEPQFINREKEGDDYSPAFAMRHC